MNNKITVHVRLLAPIISCFLIWGVPMMDKPLPLWLKILFTLFFIYDAIDIERK